MTFPILSKLFSTQRTIAQADPVEILRNNVLSHPKFDQESEHYNDFYKVWNEKDAVEFFDNMSSAFKKWLRGDIEAFKQDFLTTTDISKYDDVNIEKAWLLHRLAQQWDDNGLFTKWGLPENVQHEHVNFQEHILKNRLDSLYTQGQITQDELKEILSMDFGGLSSIRDISLLWMKSDNPPSFEEWDALYKQSNAFRVIRGDMTEDRLNELSRSKFVETVIKARNIRQIALYEKFLKEKIDAYEYSMAGEAFDNLMSGKAEEEKRNFIEKLDNERAWQKLIGHPLINEMNKHASSSQYMSDEAFEAFTEVLVKLGGKAYIETQDDKKWTSLHRAAYAHNARYLQRLIDWGADIHAVTGDGAAFSAMHMVTGTFQYKNLEDDIDYDAAENCIWILMLAGLDPDEKNVYGLTATDHAQTEKMRDIMINKFHAKAVDNSGEHVYRSVHAPSFGQ